MRKSLLVALLALATTAHAGRTQEVLVLTTATAMPQLTNRRGLLLENRGPNTLWCAFSAAAAVVNKSHRVATGERFAVNSADALWCLAETAAQVTGAATVVSEVP